MKHLKKFESFQNLEIDDKTLYIFDFDDTLVIAPKYRDIIKYHNISEEEFELSDLSLPDFANKDMQNFYNSVKYKAIVTGRHVSFENKIIDKLRELDFRNPEIGLFCFPHINGSDDKISEWKGETIVELIKNNSFASAVFFDDRVDWTQKATEIVKRKLPNVNFKAITV